MQTEQREASLTCGSLKESQSNPEALLIVADAIGREYLDGHLTIQTRIASAGHLAHSACSDEGEDFVRTSVEPGESASSLIGDIIGGIQRPGDG